MNSPLEPKSKCTRTSSILELKFSGTLTEIEGRGEVDIGKGVPNHYKYDFALSIIISLFIVLELN